MVFRKNVVLSACGWSAFVKSGAAHIAMAVQILADFTWVDREKYGLSSYHPAANTLSLLHDQFPQLILLQWTDQGMVFRVLVSAQQRKKEDSM